MKWLFGFLLLSCTQLVIAANCDVMDDAGNRIIFAAPAKRIISLAPDITETLFAIGAGADIIGVMKGSDYPENAKALPLVGSYNGLDLERILTMHPDLIVVWGNGFARQIAVLKAQHIPVYISQPQQLDDIPKTMRHLGCLSGHDVQASQQASLFEKKLASLRGLYERRPAVRVFYQLGTYSLMTINHASWINQVITLCGGRNVFASAITVAPEVSWESVIAANPAVILNDSTDLTKWQQPWRRFSIAAVNHERLYNVTPDLLDRAGPRLADGADQVCRLLDLAR